MLLGAVVHDPDAHLVPGGDREFGDAGAVEFGAEPVLRVQARIQIIFFDFFF